MCLQINGETLEPPRPLPWYPDKLAWHMKFSREQLRNNPKLNEVILRAHKPSSQASYSLAPPESSQSPANKLALFPIESSWVIQSSVRAWRRCTSW